MQDTELVDLCKINYRKHRDTIDLIVDYGASSEVLDVCEEPIPKMVSVEYIYCSVWMLRLVCPQEHGKARAHLETLRLERSST